MSRRSGRRRRWLAAGAVVLVAAAGVSAWMVARGGGTSAAQPLATTTARRATLTQTVDASFALAKDGTSKLGVPAGGTVTSVAITEGKAVKALTRLAGIDGKAVYGIPSNYPLYRDLAEGDEGADVTALQQALAAAGYDPGDADGDFGSGTADALADWQADHDLDETGQLSLASFVSYKPGAVVDEVTVAGGDPLPPRPDAAAAEERTPDGLHVRVPAPPRRPERGRYSCPCRSSLTMSGTISRAR